MPVTTSRDVEMEAAALRLYVPGVFGHKRVATQLGISKTSVRRYVDPAFRERIRKQSLEAKRRRTGTCERCGGVTRYNGRTTNGPSRICTACNTAPRTHCLRGHELTPENRLYTKAGAAWCCRICRNAYMREYAHRKRREAGVPERGPYLTRRLASEEAAS